MKANITKEPPFARVTFGGRVYGITFSGDRFGVCRDGFGRVKYMPVAFAWNDHYYFPKLNKTRLSMLGTAEELFDNIETCSLLKSYAPECVQICEHILKYGRTPR